MSRTRPNLRRLEPDQWRSIADNAHLVLFKEQDQGQISTVDFSLIYATDEELFTYATVIEIDKLTAHMQHGGAMPNAAGSVMVARAYAKTMDYLKAGYKRITTRIHHRNTAMLKLAMNEGLIIRGCDYYKDGVYVHLDWGFE